MEAKRRTAVVLRKNKNNHIITMSSIRNIYFEKPIVNRMTQGSIINGCVADAFPGEEVFGLIITPRCDVSHEGKVDSVHYLPVVPFERWFEIIAKPKIKDIWKKSLLNKLDSKLKNAKVGKEVMSANFSYEDLISICDAKVNKENDKKDIKGLLDSYFEKNEDDFDLFLLDAETKGIFDKKHELFKYLLRLEGNNIPPYYLLESWLDFGIDKHLVVMLRDVHRVQFSTAMRIKEGVFESEFTELDLKYNDLFLQNDPKNFFWVQAEINSPFIEHIMQAFVYNFSRIGVDDRPGKTIDYLFNSVKTTIQ